MPLVVWRGEVRGLYIHIPFCVRKCSYCDFYSLPNRQDSIESYVHALLKEANAYSPSFVRRDLKGELYQQKSCFDTLYIGGGTPSLLGSKHLTTLITGLNNTLFVIPAKAGIHTPASPNRYCEGTAAIPGKGAITSVPVGSGSETLRDFARNGEILSRADEMYDRPNPTTQAQNEPTSLLFKERLRENSFKVNDGSTSFEKVEGVQLLESTIEVNPESSSPEFLAAVKNLGFTRVSFGVQSLNDDELRSVGRIHTAKQAVAAIKLAQKLHIPAISADLIIGLPGQTWTSLHKSLSTLLGLGIQHLSVYCLSLETGTPLAENPPPNLPSDDTQAGLFEQARSFLLDSGFAHYEISNFALPGYECLHNLNYWHGGEYLGLGPAAASHLDGKRFKNKANLDAYLQNPTGQIEYVEELTAKDKAAEEAMLRLRLLVEGLNTDELTAKFGPANTSGIIGRLDKMAQEGLLLKTGRKYTLPPARILTSNPIFARVLG